MVSGILLFAGCVFLGNEYETPAGPQLESTPGSQSKALTAPYSDMGSDGAIKPHSGSSYKMGQEPQSQPTGQ